MATINGTAPTAKSTRTVSQPENYIRHVRRTFGRTMRGYSPAEVDAHLAQVEGWFSLAGFDRLVEERRDELLGAAQREAEATAERARREAQAILERARRESEAVLAEARRREKAVAAAERRVAEIKRLAAEILDEEPHGAD